ncbi:MAG: HEAT repeat domain-containing protein, partial [Anaerolineae bacterium]|nr:HEAT repeat domain-containing protein [Anaerolineae bacterium]
DPERRARAIQVLGEIGDTRALTYIADYLNDASDPVRLAAALAIEAQAERSLPAKLQRSIVDQACVLLSDPVERVRQIALSLLGRLGDQDAYAEMVPVLADPSLEIRTAAADALVQARRAAIPLVHPQLDGADPQLRKMASFVLTRIDPEKYGPLIYTHITSNLLTIYQNVGQIAALADLSRFSSVSVLQSSLREQNDELIEEIFYLLTALHPREDVMLVAESLQNESARVRANAAEALESLTSPQMADLIVPLFQPNKDVDQLITLSQATWDMKPPSAAQAIKQLLATPEVPLVRAISTFTLGELGATFDHAGNGADRPAFPAESPTETDVSPTSNPDPLAALAKSSTQSPEEAIAVDEEDDPKPKRRRRRGRPDPADLLGVLSDESTPDKPASAPEETAKPKRRRRSPDDILGALANIGESRSTAEPVPDRPLSAAPPNIPFTLPEIEAMIDEAFTDGHIDVRLAARAAKRTIKGVYITDIQGEEVYLLSTIEKVIFLKEVPFFQGMTVYQLEVLANICEEKLYREDERIFEQDDAGGALFVIVNGQVGIEQERRRGSFARVATLGPRAYFGETSLFDNSPRSSAAIALQDTLALRLRREPLIALARQYPDLSLELITVLSQRLRDAQSRIAELTRS